MTIMRDDIKKRIEAVRRGEVPEGYSVESAMLYPNDWGAPTPLNRVLRENKERNEKLVYGKEDVLSVSGEEGIVNQIQLMGRSYAGESVAPYHVVETGDVVYTKSPLKGNPYGIIKQNHGKPGIVSTLYAVYHCSNPITGQYLENYFTIDTYLNNYLKPLVKRGAKNDMKVNNEEVLLGRIPLPPIREQRSINEVIDRINTLILQKQKLMEELQQLKKSCLAKMFPQKGCTTPEIRFPGFTDPWEQRKLGEMVQFSKGSGYSKGDLKESGTPIILYGRLYTKYETVISDVDTFADVKTGSVYRHGGEVIIPASGENAEEISIASVVEKPGVLLGGDLNIITPPPNLDSAFLAISISNGKPHSDMAKMAQGKSVVHLHNTDLEKIDLSFPSHAEQEKISAYFKRIDALITLHQREMEEVKRKKKALMQLLLTGLVRVNN